MLDPYAPIALKAGTTLFEEGEIGSCAYLITMGRIRIFIRRGPEEFDLAVRSAGDIVGEMAIIDASPRSASARVLEDCVVVPIGEEQIQHRLSETDPILRMCLGVILGRYRETVLLLKDNQTVKQDAVSLNAPTDFQAALEALAAERELRRAIDRRQFELFFQPIVRLDTQRLAGFEALIRWRHPERGLVSPLDFIPIAEASGLITEITSWVVSEVGRVMPEIALAALTNAQATEGALFLSLNISGHDLAMASFPALVAEMLRQTGIDAQTLKLEVTESTLMRNPARAAETLFLCREAGMGIAIDDFGTGYSSLSYLSTLPITTLKIDRSFVSSMLADSRNRRIIQTILRLADEIEVPVVAEGIEEAAEATALSTMGCAFGQGYLFGRPVPLAQTLAVIRDWGRGAAQPYAASA